MINALEDIFVMACKKDSYGKSCKKLSFTAFFALLGSVGLVSEI